MKITTTCMTLRPTEMAWVLAVVAASVLTPSPAHADDPPLVGAVPAYFLPPGDRPLGIQLNEQLVTQIATFPIGSSSGAFTFETIDPTLGLQAARSRSFGPIFSERWQTLGAKKASMGLSFQHVTFDSFWGHDLETGGLKYPGWTDNGLLVENSVRLEVSTSSTVFGFSYGVRDDLDVTVLVPFVRAHIHQVLSTELVRNIVTGAPMSGPFGAGPFAFTGSSAGLGDVVFRGKWNVIRKESGGLSAVMDVRTPTGDRDNLLGVGSAQWKPQATAGWDIGRYSLRANLGYTFSGGWQTTGLTGETYEAAPSFRLLDELRLEVPDELNYVFGADWSPTERATFVGDLIGRRLFDTGRVVQTQSTATYFDASGAHPVTADVLRVRDGGFTTLLANAGVRLNVGRTWLASVSVLFPLTDSGLKSRVTPVFGVEYAF